MHNPEVLKTVLKKSVRCYQLLISPAVTAALGPRCRFYPNCSEYALQSLDKDPVPVALKKITGRLFKCGPWHPGGIDLP